MRRSSDQVCVYHGISLPSPWLLLTLYSLCLCGSIVFAPLRAGAHPLGTFTVNRYSRIEIGPENVAVQYVLDMAEIPAFQELRALDRDITTDETAREAYAARQAAVIRSRLHLRLDGAAVNLKTEAVTLTFPTGQGALPTLRLAVRYSAGHRTTR
jgi:nickel/cobalt exporter